MEAPEMNRSEWATPQPFFDRVNAEFGFTLDACALPHNAKVGRYFTPEQNSLEQSWSGEVVWLNPPYGDGIENWLAKAPPSFASSRPAPTHRGGTTTRCWRTRSAS